MADSAPVGTPGPAPEAWGQGLDLGELADGGYLEFPVTCTGPPVLQVSTPCDGLEYPGPRTVSRGRQSPYEYAAEDARPWFGPSPDHVTVTANFRASIAPLLKALKTASLNLSGYWVQPEPVTPIPLRGAHRHLASPRPLPIHGGAYRRRVRARRRR